MKVRWADLELDAAEFIVTGSGATIDKFRVEGTSKCGRSLWSAWTVEVMRAHRTARLVEQLAAHLVAGRRRHGLPARGGRRITQAIEAPQVSVCSARRQLSDSFRFGRAAPWVHLKWRTGEESSTGREATRSGRLVRFDAAPGEICCGTLGTLVQRDRAGYWRAASGVSQVSGVLVQQFVLCEGMEERWVRDDSSRGAGGPYGFRQDSGRYTDDASR
jgi:hypothetical protein